VRTEFYRLYPGDAEIRRKAFNRSLQKAVETGALYSINNGPDLAKTILWARHDD
jgi:hypothetical protein